MVHLFGRTEHLFKGLLREYIESVILVIFIGLVVRWTLIAPYRIVEDSLDPILQNGDFVFGYKPSFGLTLPFMDQKLGRPSLPERGDLVVFKDPEDEGNLLIRRVAGVPGDVVIIQKSKLLVNESLGYALQPPQPGETSSKASGATGPVVVPPQHLYVYAPRSDGKDDSREMGPIPLSFVEARIVTIWLSMSSRSSAGGWGIRWDRMFRSEPSPSIDSVSGHD